MQDFGDDDELRVPAGRGVEDVTEFAAYTGRRCRHEEAVDIKGGGVVAGGGEFPASQVEDVQRQSPETVEDSVVRLRRSSRRP